ncbi:hypothetical protein D5273_03305 [Enterorhabdus caecimuris]|nr:hypothetical protein [Adlercreutzia caecimuris]
MVPMIFLLSPMTSLRLAMHSITRASSGSTTRLRVPAPMEPSHPHSSITSSNWASPSTRRTAGSMALLTLRSISARSRLSAAFAARASRVATLDLALMQASATPSSRSFDRSSLSSATLPPTSTSTVSTGE